MAHELDKKRVRVVLNPRGEPEVLDAAEVDELISKSQEAAIDAFFDEFEKGECEQ